MSIVIRSIKTKLTLGVVFIVVLLLAVLLLLSYTSLTRYSLNNALELSEIILNETDSKISRFFLELNYLTESLKNNSTVYRVKTDLMKELFITTVQARNEYLRAIYLGTSQGDMYEWGIGEGFIDNTPTFPEGYDPRVRPWYKAAMVADGFAISKPYIYASINALGITCGVPVYDENNIFIGVLGLDIILKGLSNMINDLQVQKQGRVILLNQNYEILADQFNTYTENITRLKKFANPELLKGGSGYFINIEEEDKVLTSYKIIESTDWILLVSIPYSEIMEFSNQTLSIILLSEFFLMFVLTVVLTLLLHKIITEPMGKMIGVMKAIEDGNVDTRIVVRGEDEFSILGKMFNQLEDIRQQYTTSMEKEIESRTREITELQNENIRLRIIEEKERIFGNLHDSLGARLTNIFISNSVAKKASKSNKKLLEDMLERIDKNTKQGIKDLKEIIFGPATGDRVIIDFVKLLELNIRERLKLKNIELKFNPGSIEEFNSLKDTLRFEIKILLEEIVSNILKHAEADTVYLDLEISSNNILIDIRDNGVGFKYGKNRDTGFGIRSILSRIERLNGNVQLIASQGRGVEYKISIPFIRETEND